MRRARAAQHTISGLRDGAEQSWNLVATDGGTTKLQHRHRLLCSDYTVQFEAAAGGVGIALLPLRIAWHGLESGALVQVAKDWGTAEPSIPLVCVSCRGTLPSVQSLLDHLVQHIPTALA